MKLRRSSDGYLETKLPDKLLSSLMDKGVKLRFTSCVKNPSESQLEALNCLVLQWSRVVRIMMKESVSLWNASILRDPEIYNSLKHLANDDELVNKLHINSVYIHNDLRWNKFTTIAFSGHWDIDDEHGYGAVFSHRNGMIRFKELGHEYDAFTDISESYQFENRRMLEEQIEATIEDLNLTILQLEKVNSDGKGILAKCLTEHINITKNYLKTMKKLRSDKNYIKTLPQ